MCFFQTEKQLEINSVVKKMIGFLRDYLNIGVYLSHTFFRTLSRFLHKTFGTSKTLEIKG
jgi:hypothetical protein